MTIITLQPAPIVDYITPDGSELMKLPYPFHVDTDGSIGRQDFWNGYPLRVLGFVADPNRMQIDLYWEEIVKNPQRAVGMYVVTEDADRVFSTHVVAIASVREDA